MSVTQDSTGENPKVVKVKEKGKEGRFNALIIYRNKELVSLNQIRSEEQRQKMAEGIMRGRSLDRDVGQEGRVE